MSLWIADVTYIRQETEFVYLALVLDAYSPRVIGVPSTVGVCLANIGRSLDRTPEDDLAIAALQRPSTSAKPQKN